MNTTPKVSVLMPAYNAELYIGEAIDSILAQTYTDYECIIIDDGSSDRTREIIQQYASKDERIVAVQNEQNLRICKTLNKWIHLAKWVYIARMDADDICFPERLQLQVDFMNADLSVGIVWWNMDIMDESGTVYSSRTYHQTDAEIRKHIFRYSPFCHPATMIRKSVLLMSGLYNESWIYAEDYDLYFRIWQFSSFSNLTETLLKYRILDNGMTWSKSKYMENCTQYVKLKAIFEYGYVMSYSDKVYTLLQRFSSFIIKWEIRLKLFNYLRD